MSRSLRSLASAVAMLAASAAQAQTAVLATPPQNVLSLAASGSIEVPRDWLTIVMSTSRDGPDAAGVQAQLKQALDAALVEARKAAKPGQVEVRTGSFYVGPRYNQRSQIGGWSGSAELILEGRDVATLAQLAGRLQTLTVSRTGFSLSREAREKVEAEVAALAIGRFRAQAEAYAKLFGFAGYGIREVQINQGSDMPVPMPTMRVAAAAAPQAEAALPVEAGKATVTVSVNGSVQMSIK